MSRSRRKSPFVGHTCSKSDQPWKAKASRAFRHAAELEAHGEPDEMLLPVKRWAVVNLWDAPKDGKQRLTRGLERFMRK